MVFIPYRETYFHGEDRLVDQYETITCLSEYSNFSLEELRVKHYRQKKRRNPAVNNMSWEDYSALLQGPGVEIRVGVSTPQHEETGTYNNWCLPQNLTSHFSPFLKAACLRSFKERHECRIELPEDDARVFTLFVQWMYYGEYHIPTLSEEASKSFFCIHARCWILGDKLLCTKFKNYAMSRIYGQHTTSFAPTPVTIQDVDYVCKNSVLHSKLRTFYFAFVIEHFADQDRLLGTTEEWDKLLLVHADVRLLMVQSFRMPPEEQMYVEDEEYYLDQDDILATSFEKTNIGDDILEQTRDVRTKN